jgi:DNA-binding winged helix-turn-helix (wHTH) protein/tetratricopeptide (TPR) repeat protein
MLRQSTKKGQSFVFKSFQKLQMCPMPMKAREIFQFGEFQIDARARTLRREDEIVTLNYRAFDVLVYFAQNPGRALTRDELLKNVWPDTYVDEHSLAQSISVLRRALEEKPGDNSYIVTLPGRGYQFVAPVRVVSQESLAIVPDAATSARPGGMIFQQQTIRTSVITEEQVSSGTAALPESRAARVPELWKIAVPVLLAALLVAGGFYYHARQRERLTEKDTIVLGDFANSTGDAIFDDTLKTALNISLRQSPFLNVLPDSQVTKTLQLMTRPAGTKLTPEVARELCQRAGSKAYIAGAIGSLGSEYVLQLKAVNCLSGDTLAEKQVTAASKEKVLDTLGEAASKLRGELGESLATVQKFDAPLSPATTNSLEALKAYAVGIAHERQSAAAALPYFQRSVELDPNFARGYLGLANQYTDLGKPSRANEYLTKAFQLRGHTSELEKLRIAGVYYMQVTGELDKAAQTYQAQIEDYPRDPIIGSVGNLYAELGQYEKAAEATRQAQLLSPDFHGWYSNLATYALSSQRFDEAQKIIDQAQAKKIDNFQLRIARYALAFFGSDSAGMAEQQQWFAGKAEYANFGLALASDTEAYAGHAAEARELIKRAVDSAVRTDNKEVGAIYLAIAAQREAVYGRLAEARQGAVEALKLAPTSPGAAAEAALAFALAGDTGQAESLAQDLEERFPFDTQMQSLWLPAIRAQLALDENHPAPALMSLQAASAIELGTIPFVNNISCLYPTYVRGEAFLAAGQGSASAAEFQKILDHSGIVWNCWTGALAHLGLARANALQSKTTQGVVADAARVRALAAYNDFLTLWKEADPDIPILKQAKAEYAKLKPLMP